MTGRHRAGQVNVGLEVLTEEEADRRTYTSDEPWHHVESYMTDALSGGIHEFGAQCFTCPWEATGLEDMRAADEAADRHREETHG